MDGMIGGVPGGAGYPGPSGNEGPASACGLDGADALGGAVPFDRVAGEGMIVEIGGEYFDLGPGTADTDGDGIADSVTLADDRGLSIFSDVDGDGAVDHVTTVLFDGTYETWTAASGEALEEVPEDASGATSGATSEISAGSSGGTSSGVSGDVAEAGGSPSTWGVHEWERGERGRWA
ncbi:DUF6802 family protein [Corynebacterium xerosis]|uniref:DUF6802 family protein n=1 Tax=Corynebacterium xerosis TaxID=1725 RepID=UPI00390812C7